MGNLNYQFSRHFYQYFHIDIRKEHQKNKKDPPFVLATSIDPDAIVLYDLSVFRYFTKMVDQLCNHRSILLDYGDSNAL